MAYTTIDKGSSYFNTVLYTGTGAIQSITGVGFQPDWVWIKARSGAANHCLYDAVRGSTKELNSDSTAVETTRTSGLTAFDSNGFTIGALARLNTSAVTYTSWNWLANGTGVSNTAGTITSTVSANTTSGFSIVSYTGNGTSGATVGHGLGVAPKMVIGRRRATIENWMVNHTSASGTAGSYVKLNTTDAVITGNAVVWNNTNPSSTVFTLGTDTALNGNGSTYIAYCFADVKGYSKFGSYTGNGSTDGTFVYTGFKPAFVLIKITSTTGEWIMYDNKRDSSNVVDLSLSPTVSTAEDFSANDELDFLSNGFKWRSTGAVVNASGATFIYMAFAENPFVSSKGLPCTAR